MAVGKRLDKDEPLTEHDVAERLDKAALRTYRILWDARALGMVDEVKASRYLTNIINALAAELAEWGIEPHPLKRTEEP